MKNKMIIVIMVFLLGGCAFVDINDTDDSFSFPKAGTDVGGTSLDSVKPDDEAGQFYFTCKNRDYDIYMGNTFTPYESFSILSLQSLDVEEIQVTVPIDTTYTVEISLNEDEDFHLTDYLLNKDLRTSCVQVSRNTFPYYLYQCYRDTDWEKMKQLYQKAVKNEKKYETYLDYRDFYIEDYRALKSEDLPVFYVYDVTVWFGYSEESLRGEKQDDVTRISETIDTIQIQIEDKTYIQKIGEIRLHAEGFPEELSIFNANHMKNQYCFSVGTETYPWGDGIVCKEIDRFQAKTDLTLTGVSLYENDMTIIGGRILTTDVENGEWELHEWDTKTPFEVKNGTFVKIELIFYDERMTQMEYVARVVPVIQYMVGSKSYEYRTELNLDRCAWYNYWFRYAVVFNGMDEQLKAYFNEFYTPVYEAWKEKYK